MRIVRYLNSSSVPLMLALTDDEDYYKLPHDGLVELVAAADQQQLSAAQWIARHIADKQPISLEELAGLEPSVPIVAPEVWAAGVTYQRSKEARNYEATGGRLDALTVYDKVYDAPRPELFFKSTAARTIGPNQPVYLRSDSNWQIPEPELGLVLLGNGRVIGYTIGNDMSCRDIEGDNPLYLPQAKLWRHSCVIGPAIRLAETVEDPYAFEISCQIYRDGSLHFSGSASTSQLKRRYEELVGYLTLDNVIFDGTVLLTGTCVVPPNEFTLAVGDRIEIAISGIGKLINTVGSV